MNLIQLPLNLLGSAPAFWRRLDAAQLCRSSASASAGCSRIGASPTPTATARRSWWCRSTSCACRSSPSSPGCSTARRSIVFVFLGSAIIIVGIILNLRAEARRCMELVAAAGGGASPRRGVAARRARRSCSACSAMPAPARPPSPATSPKAVEGEVAFGAYTGKAALGAAPEGLPRTPRPSTR